MITALGNGAQAIFPVQDIPEALEVRRRQPEVLLAGERNGLRIAPGLAQGTAFDLGNSPREFTSDLVKGRTIVMTTTNGTRALSACRHAHQTLVCSFLNLNATAAAIAASDAPHLLVVCSGTEDQAAYEDVLGAGAFCDLVWGALRGGTVTDSAQMARQLFLESKNDLLGAISKSRNARRLLSIAELRQDVAFCLQRDLQPVVATLGKDGLVRRLPALM
jgi:2-phosphosulfolactate phosphatase